MTASINPSRNACSALVKEEDRSARMNITNSSAMNTENIVMTKRRKGEVNFFMGSFLKSLIHMVQSEGFNRRLFLMGAATNVVGTFNRYHLLTHFRKDFFINGYRFMSTFLP